MNSVVIFLAMFAATTAISCDTCVELDWGENDYAALNLSTSVSDDIPICSSAESAVCEDSEVSCGNGTFGMSVSGTTNGTGFTIEFNLEIQGCTSNTSTCDDIEADILDAIGEADDYTFAVTSCD